MKIFEKRPLALILCIIVGGFSFFADYDIKCKLIIAAVTLAIISAIYIFEDLKRCRNAIVILSLVALSLSLVASSIWSAVYFPHDVYDTNARIKARAYDIDNSDSKTSVITLKTVQIDGKREKHKFIAYVDKSISVNIREYDVIEINADVVEFSDYDDGFDGRSYYISRGYSALLTNISDLEVIENKIDIIDSFFSKLQLKISNTLKLRTDYKTGSFLAALIVGDRSSLSGNTKLNFARLGISHILALSGMHLAILSFAINSLLTRFGIKKNYRAVILITLVLFYMALTGFGVSVLRSGIMLIIANLLFLISKKSDGITSLSIAVFLITVVTPTSVFDMSLWLSAFATLGVICFSEIAEKSDKDDSWLKKALISLKNGTLVSVFAICATFAFTANRFSAFSVVSVITTLIFSFVIQFFIYGGLLLLLIGGFVPFGKIIVLFSNAILLLAEWISSLKYVYVSGESFAVKLAVVLLTVFFFAFLVFDMKNKMRGVAFICIITLIVFAIGEIDTIMHVCDDDVIYSPSPSGDTVLIKSDSDITAIYSGKSLKDNAFDITDIFTDEHLTYVDNFVLANYSYTTIDFTKTIISSVKVEKLMVPAPSTDEEIGIAEGLSYLLSDYGTSLEFYDLRKYIEFGDIRYRLFEKVDYIYGKYPSNVFEIVKDEDRFTYLSVCDYDLLSPSAKALIFNSEKMIIGSIGNNKYYIFDMKLPSINRIIYFDDGRLTSEAENYYKEKGASIENIKTPFSIFN